MKVLEILKEQYNMLSKDTDGVWIDPEKIDEAIKELEKIVKEHSVDRLAELEEKKMNDLIESIKTTSEYSKYIQAKKDLKDVLKGGKDYPSCSFMDISIRDDRFEARKKELIECIGTFILNKIEENGKIRARGVECE